MLPIIEEAEEGSQGWNAGRYNCKIELKTIDP